MIPPVTDDLWHFAGGGGVVYAYPGVYDISVTRVSEDTEYSVDSVPSGATIDLFDADEPHQIDIVLNEETKAWQQEQFVPLLESCIRGESPEQALCPDLNVADVESIDVGEVSDSLPGSVAAYNITVTTREHRIWLDVRGAVCFDDTSSSRSFKSGSTADRSDSWTGEPRRRPGSCDECGVGLGARPTSVCPPPVGRTPRPPAPA